MYTRNFTVKKIRNKYRNYNGGYGIYFKLYLEFIRKMKQMSFMMKTRQKVWTWFAITLQVIFKPILWVFHTVTNYEAKFCIVNGELFKIVSFSKEKTFYFLRVIPIWYYETNKPSTKQDFEVLK